MFTLAERATTYTKTESDATAANFTSLIGTAKTNIADILTCSAAALETFHVFSEVPGEKNTLEVKW